VIRLRLPALRERREDVFMLTRHFLQQSAKQLGVEPKRISDTALQQLSNFGFPGNVRQLENICHWLTVMAPAQVIEPKDLPPEVLGMIPEPGKPLASVEKTDAVRGDVTGSADKALPVHAPELAVPAAASLDQGWETGLEAEALALLATGRSDVWDVLTRRFESRLIQTALANTRGRRIEAAQKLGIGRNTITRKIQELNLE
ncbi:MAG: nitrogen regulation protein NR(I), partial [Polaromonas sp.]|nr:nitrogen regulation protein NR(I) [Polaromonas sp.]